MARTLFISPVLHAPLSYRSDPRQDDRNAFSFLRFIKPPGGSSLSLHHLPHRQRAEAPFSSVGRILGSRPSDSSPVDLIVSERDEEKETSVSPSGSVPPGGDAFFIKIEKSGRNRRRVRARVRVATSLEAVWDVLTDYERLIDFIPGLAVCRLIERSGGFVRMFQIGQQSLAFGFKFNAKGTMDCYENDLELLPFGRRRNIDFTMIEGDFQLFRGKWSMVQAEESHISFFPRTTFLSYIVDVEPKLWLPVSLVEKRLCNEIELNLLSIREEALKRSATDALSDLS
ncbi:hypothetical protein EJ110_NYTH02347 [Nymphaea thermarum]|nr:hypothetical protein EJ110_NYTH02347 [Nymphaea thermarum]